MFKQWQNYFLKEIMEDVLFFNIIHKYINFKLNIMLIQHYENQYENI